MLITDIVEILNYISKHEHSAFFYTPLVDGNEISYLFKQPSKSVICTDAQSINESLNMIEKLSKKFDFAYGSISYETGYYFEEKLEPLLSKSKQRFITFQFFNKDEVEEISTKSITYKNIRNLLKDNEFKISALKLNESQTEYEKKINRIKNYIEKGDTYQVNYTLKANFYVLLKSLFTFM